MRDAGYEVAHRGTVLVGESVVEDASGVLSLGGPVVLCGTVKAVGTGWAHKLVNAAHRHSGVRVFPVKIEKDAYLEAISFEVKSAQYWQDPAKALEELLAALRHYYPLDETQAQARRSDDAEEHYRALLLETCDIVNLANLPEQDRILAQRQLELRRLYVPLRVWIEAEVGEESEEAEWDSLEMRRVVDLKSRADNERVDRNRQRVPVGERLAKARRLVVLGDPGAGKTTLTRWIATSYLLRLKNDPDWQDVPDVKTLPDENWLPIIVRCRDLDQTCLSGNLGDILSHTLRKAELTGDEASTLLHVLRQRLQEGTALLMLDGLDEIAESPTRASFCQHLEQIHVAYPNAPIIATSRIVGYREMGLRLGRGFEHVTLADLDREEKDDFARRWCDLTELPERSASAARELIHDIHSIDRIERMTGNPMLLTTMALVKRKVGKLPSHRADLYWEAVQVLLNWRSEVDKPLDQHEAIPQLEYIAYAMCDRGVQQLRRDEILDLIAQMRAEYPNLHETRNHIPKEFLHLLEARTGLLMEAVKIHHLGMVVPVYEFRHLTFQEYLAARALVDSRFPERNSNRSLAEQVAPLAGRTENVAFTGIFSRIVAEVAVVENWREALRLCIAICSDDDVDDVLCSILTPQDGEPETTTRARAILATLCVADEPNVSEEIVQKVFQAFASQVKDNDGGWDVRTSASAATMEVARTRWAAQLCISLVNEFCQRDATNRNVSGSLCGMVGASCAPKDPTKLDTWWSVQVDRLLNGNEHDAIKTALTLMQLAYENNTHGDELQFMLIPGLADALLSRLEDSAPMTHAAAWALGWLNKGSIFTNGKNWRPELEHIERILTFIGKSDADPEAVRFLTWIMQNEKIEDAVEPLLAWLDHPSPALRKGVAEALGLIGSERAVEPLIAKLDDPEAGVRRAAARALGRIGSEDVVEPLIAKLNDHEAEVRAAVANALGSIGSEDVVEPLIAKLDDPEAEVRAAVASALGRIGSKRAVEPLIAKLDETEAGVRRAAARALGSIGSERVVELLIAKLDEPEARVKWAVANALGSIGSERAVEPLITKLDEPEARVKWAVANALGSIGSERAVEPLIAKLDDPEANMRKAALQALSQDFQETDRSLLSWDLDGPDQFLDPHQEISTEFASKAAEILGLTIEDVQARYEAMAERFHLRLAWRC